MHLEAVVDSFYILGSLWGGLTGPQVCISSRATLPRAAREAVWTPASGTSAAATAFIDVNVVPMDRERVLTHQTVLVEGGKITALGPASTVKVPVGAVRVDGRGKYLMPGLADMHYHINSLTKPQISPDGVLHSRLFAKLARGVTTIRHLTEGTSKVATLQQPEGTNLTPGQMARLVETVAVPMPRIYLSPSIPRSLTPDSVAAYVAAVRAVGYRHLTIPFNYTTSTDEQLARHERTMLDSLVAAGGRVGLPLASHSHWLPFARVLALGPTGGSTEHMTAYLSAYWRDRGFSGSLQESWDASMSDTDLRGLAATLQRAGVWMTPTLGCSEGRAVSPARIEVLRRFVRILQETGVGLLLAEDDSKYDVHTELGALVGAGLTPYQALVSGTRNPAQFLGLGDSTGTVTVGKRADLVLLSANPLADVRHAREPAGVMVAGRWLDRAELDRYLVALGVTTPATDKTP